MVVFILEKVPVSLRGELTRWLLEPKTGVFVGRISAMVRDKLWERVCKGTGTGGCILIHATDTEQGFALRFHGVTQRSLMDFDGISLIKVP